MDDANGVFFIADDALEIPLESTTDRYALSTRLWLSGDWLDVIPGATGISVRYNPMKWTPAEALGIITNALSGPPKAALSKPKHWVIPVCYAPEFAFDIDEICTATGLSQSEIIARHTQTLFEVDMMGFTPGFGYLKADDFVLDMPRLATPRQHVPAGSVGLARRQCGLYALDGPGGWPIVGRTPFALFDQDAADPFRLNPGDSVKFEAISEDAFWAAAL